MLDPVISNSISLTSWKCEASVTLVFDRSLQGKGWACMGKRRSKLVFGMPSFSFRKWNIYVGGSLPQESSRKQSEERLNSMFKQSINQSMSQRESELTVHNHSVESHLPKMDTEHKLCPTVLWAMGQLRHQIWWKQILESYLSHTMEKCTYISFKKTTNNETCMQKIQKPEIAINLPQKTQSNTFNHDTFLPWKSIIP